MERQSKPPSLTRWSSCGMCINWNELQYLTCATHECQLVAMATRSVVAPRNVITSFNVNNVDNCLATYEYPTEYTVVITIVY